MKKLLSRIGILTVLVATFFTGTIFAESKVSQYTDPEFKFQSIKTVAIAPVIMSFQSDDPYALENTKVVFEQEFKDLPFEIIWLEPGVTKEEVLAAYQAGEYQAVMRIQVKSMGWDSKVIPGHYENYWDPVVVGGWGYDEWWGGWGVASVPSVEYVPSTVENNAAVSVAFSMLDLDKKKMVWGFTEDRYDDGGAFSKPSPEKSLKTIVKEAKKSLEKAADQN